MIFCDSLCLLVVFGGLGGLRWFKVILLGLGGSWRFVMVHCGL